MFGSATIKGSLLSIAVRSIDAATMRRWQAMTKLARAVLLAVLALCLRVGATLASDACYSKAIGPDGQPLTGSTLTAFMTTCLKDACDAKAIDKNGNKLTGAVKDSFMKRCQGRR